MKKIDVKDLIIFLIILQGFNSSFIYFRRA